MSLICYQVEIIDGIQYGTACVEYTFFNSLAITKTQAIQISKEIGTICAICIAYTFLAKAGKLL